MRSRTSHLHNFENLPEVETTLQDLSLRDDRWSSSCRDKQVRANRALRIAWGRHQTSKSWRQRWKKAEMRLRHLAVVMSEWLSWKKKSRRCGRTNGFEQQFVEFKKQLNKPRINFKGEHP